MSYKRAARVTGFNDLPFFLYPASLNIQYFREQKIYPPLKSHLPAAKGDRMNPWILWWFTAIVSQLKNAQHLCYQWGELATCKEFKCHFNLCTHFTH